MAARTQKSPVPRREWRVGDGADERTHRLRDLRRAALRAFESKLNLPYPLYGDPDHATYRALERQRRLRRRSASTSATTLPFSCATSCACERGAEGLFMARSKREAAQSLAAPVDEAVIEPPHPPRGTSTRFVVDTDGEMLVGASFVGPEVAEFLHAATIAVVAEVPLRTLVHAVAPFPARTEIWLKFLEAYGF